MFFVLNLIEKRTCLYRSNINDKIWKKEQNLYLLKETKEFVLKFILSPRSLELKTLRTIKFNYNHLTLFILKS